MPALRIFQDDKSLTAAAVEKFCFLAQNAIHQRGNFTAALSGGSTPRSLYQALASPPYLSQIDWRKVHLFWGDERHVPPDHPESNFRMVKEAMLDEIPIPDENVHRVPAELDVHQAAQKYEEDLKAFFKADWPRFDLVLLGMGSDGHTASLFPGSAGLSEEDRWFISNFDPKSQEWRLTLTKNAINSARQVMVIISGQAKAAALAKAIEGSATPELIPIQLLSPVEGDIVWMVDVAAASDLV